MLFRAAARLSLRFTIADKIYRTSSLLRDINNKPREYKQAHFYSIKKNETNTSKVINPKRVLSYEDMLKVVNQPEKLIIDVRSPNEVSTTGKIPSSINIPLKNIQKDLGGMSEEEFKRSYNRSKPTASDELVFHCKSGLRSAEALEQALKLGYYNSKIYSGSWTEWSSKRK